MEKQKRDVKEYRVATFWKEDDEDIVFFQFPPKLEMTIEIAHEIVESRLDYTGGKAVYTIIDGNNLKSTTKEARDYMNSVQGGLKGVKAGAFLSSNIVATLLINLYIRITHPVIPAQLFSSKQDAVVWLRRIRSEQKVQVS